MGIQVNKSYVDLKACPKCGAIFQYDIHKSGHPTIGDVSPAEHIQMHKGKEVLGVEEPFFTGQRVQRFTNNYAKAKRALEREQFRKAMGVE